MEHLYYLEWHCSERNYQMILPFLNYYSWFCCRYRLVDIWIRVPAQEIFNSLPPRFWWRFSAIFEFISHTLIIIFFSSLQFISILVLMLWLNLTDKWYTRLAILIQSQRIATIRYCECCYEWFQSSFSEWIDACRWLNVTTNNLLIHRVVTEKVPAMYHSLKMADASLSKYSIFVEWGSFA